MSANDIGQKRVGITLTRLFPNDDDKEEEELSLRPSITDTETEGTGETVTYTDQCGHEEADQVSSGNAQHAINGLFYEDVVQTLYRWYQEGATVDVTLPANLDNVSLFITDLSVKQTQENNVFVDRDGNENKLVFPTQIQLKASGAIEEGQ